MEKSKNAINEDSPNEQLKKLVVQQQCKYLRNKFETELERKELFKKL
nr:MAG TPA: hypothetical protein [Ackermannviridae sp.]